jgi:ferredoxin-thioredoxin reductase catalytic subunit
MINGKGKKDEAVVATCSQDILSNLARPGFRECPCRLS